MNGTRLTRILVLTIALMVSAACTPARRAPMNYQWGMPVYPGAIVAGTSAAKASFVLYRTGDSVEAVDAWYAAELPAHTSHAVDIAHDRSTFALFAPHDRKAVHIEREGAATTILLTRLLNP